MQTISEKEPPRPWAAQLPTDIDTAEKYGGGSHMQGLCVDDAHRFLYISYTDSLVKWDLKNNCFYGAINGFGAGSFEAVGGAHIGCLAYHQGKIYGSLEYKDPGKKFFLITFDENAFSKGRCLHIQRHEDGTPRQNGLSGVNAILLREPTEDFRAPLDDGDRITSPDGFAENEVCLGHRFGCSGIDGLTFGTLPGAPKGPEYLFVAYGIYGQDREHARWTARYDNNYNILRAYDLSRLTPQQDLPFTYQRGLHPAYRPEEALSAADTLFVWTGTTKYGVQNLEFEPESGNLLLFTYILAKLWNRAIYDGNALFVVDGQKPPILTTLELGQSCADPDPAVRAAARRKAEAYRTGGRYPTGKLAVLSCPSDAAPGPESPCGYTGVAARIFCRSLPAAATNGIAPLGGGYYYVCQSLHDDNTKIGLYRKVPGSFYDFEKVSI